MGSGGMHFLAGHVMNYAAVCLQELRKGGRREKGKKTPPCILRLNRNDEEAKI